MEFCKQILVICAIYLPLLLSSQTLFYQGICKCGVTGAGFSTAMGAGSGSFQIYIEPGSTIKKAFLFVQRFGNAKDTIITINGIQYSLNETNQVTNDVIFENTPTFSAIHCLDVTSDLQPSQTNFNITIPVQVNNAVNGKYGDIYLYVIYENPTLSSTSFAVALNNYDMTHYIQDYTVINLNTINNNFPVGFATYTDRMNAYDPHDGSYLYVENNLLGLLKGTDQTNNVWSGAGVKGNFYYQNNQLFGLDDDTPDNSMGGTDGLADISSYINNHSIHLNWKLKWERNKDFRYNIYSGFFLTYSTPCAPFPITVSADTTLCPGETVQLHASGGIKYEWASTTLSPQSAGNPAPGLSCSDCANPIFSGDSSQVYTVRIWSTDSCSVVRPVSVRVSRPQKLNLKIQDANCGIDNGAVYLNQQYVMGGIDNWSLLTPIGDTLHAVNDSSFTQLPAGNYSYYYTDTFGCRSNNWPIQIATYNNTMAYFWVSPGWGTAPLQFDIDNVSLHADHFVWTLNGVGQANPFQSFLADTAGIYTIQLIAWQYDPSCADTMKRTLEVKPAEKSVPISVNNLLTPNGDHKNDTWKIIGIEKYPHNEVTVFNRWGNVVFHQKNYQNNWNGIPNVKAMGGKGKLPNGTYFYVVTIQNKEKEQVFKGYLEVER